MSWYEQKDRLEEQLKVMRQFIRPVPEDEKAMAHIVCPNMFAMYAEIMKWLDSTHSSICRLEDKIEEDRQERAELRVEYWRAKAYYE